MKYCHIGCCIINEKVADCNSFTLERYLEALPRFREAGLRHIELSHLMALSEEDACKLREVCNTLGLSIWSVHSENFNDAGGMSPGGPYPGGSLEEYFAKQLHCAKIANCLQARVFVCHLPNYTKEPRFDLERNLEIIARLGDITRQYGLILAVENCMPGDMEHIISIVEKLDRSDIGVNLDTGHYFYTRSGDIANCINALGKHLVTLHLHDNFGNYDDHQPPGMGKIPWGGVIKALKDSPYEGPLMMELTSTGVKGNREDAFLRDFPLEKELIFGVAYLKEMFYRG